MALSDHEKRVLDELERSLYADDEKLAKRFKQVADETPARITQRNAARRIGGSVLSLAGLGVILVGVISHYTPMGIAGFLITLAGLVIATGSSGKPADAAENRAISGPNRSGTPGQVADKAARGWDSLNEFFEERWNRRMNGQ